jgi:site-specific recombinase XerD
MNALRSSLKGFFQYVYQAGWTNQDPTRLTRRAICGTPPPRALSEADQKRLMETLAQAEGFEGRRDHALFHLLLATGIRLCSALALDVLDVDLHEGMVALRTSKGNHPERVFLGRTIREHLMEYMASLFAGPLFPSRDGSRLSHRHAQRRFSMWMKKAGVTRPASIHSLRHSFGCDLYRRTGDILLVKEALLHRSICSTLVYARTDEDRLRQVLQA